MNTETTTRPEVPASTPMRSSGRWLLAAAAAVVLVVGLVAVTLAGDDDRNDVAAGPPLELSLGDSNSMASCLALDAGILATMSPAFAATATAIDGETVTLEVDRWYAGGDASVVELHAMPGQQALIAGFDFVIGERYLITAAQGTVNFCGYSGPATPELTAVFDQAFPS